MNVVTDSAMNEFTHTVADALAKLIKQSPDSIDRNDLNQRLEENLLSPYYNVCVIADED